MEKIVSKLYQWAIEKKADPSVIEFHFTDGCNQRCRFCDFACDPNKEKNSLLSDDEYINIIKESSQMDVDEIRLCGGGEPFFNKKRSMEMVSIIKNSKKKCRIITNGTMFNSEDMKKIVELKVDDIQFSVHGANTKTHDYLTKLPGAFEKVTKNILELKKEKKIQKTNYPFIAVYFILNKKNYKNIMDMAHLVASLGINRWGIYDMDLRTKESELLKLDEKERETIRIDIQKAKDYVTNHNIDFYCQETILHKPKKKNSNKIVDLLDIKKSNDLLNVPCYEPWYYLGIRGNGAIEICPSIGHFDYSIKGKSVKEIWYGEEMTHIRDLVLHKSLKGNCLFCCNLEITIPLRQKLKEKLNYQT